MKLIKPSFEILESQGCLKDIELAGRTCYQSQDKISEDNSSAITFVKNLLKRKHYAVIEFGENVVLKINEPLWSSLMNVAHMPFFQSFQLSCYSSNKILLSMNPRTAIEFLEFIAENANLYHYDSNIKKLADTIISSFPLTLVGSFVSVFPYSLTNPELYEHATLDFDIEKLVHHTVTVRISCDRGVSHEIVRHRKCSFAQKSTRYCDEKGEIEFIEPCWDYVVDGSNFILPLTYAEIDYKELRKKGWSPQEARAILPNALATEIYIKAPITEWKHIFKLRCAKAAHPQMLEIMLPLEEKFKQRKII